MTLRPAGEVEAIDWEEESLFSPNGRASNPQLVHVDEVLYLFWVEYGFNNDTLWFNEDIDGGRWFPSLVATMRVDAMAKGYDVDADDGVIHVVYQTRELSDRDIYYMNFNGTTWSSPLLLTVEKRVSNQTNPAIAVLGSQVHVVYEDDNPLDPGIYHRHFDGRTWTAAEELSTDLSEDERAQFPQVAISGKEAMVLWESPVAVRLTKYDGETWSKVTSVVPDHEIIPGNWPDLVAGPWGSVISYTDRVGGDYFIKVMMNTGSGWTSPETANMTPTHYQTQSDISYERGNLLLAYTNMDERVVFQRHDGSDWSTVEVLNRTSDEGQWVPDVLLINGVAHVVFRYSTASRADLKYFKGDIEVAPPSSIVTHEGPYWVDPGAVVLNWSLSDDFGIAGIALEYRHGTDNATWSDWTEFASEGGLSGPDANGMAGFEPPDGDGFYQFRSVATDIWGNVEPPHVEADAAFGVDTQAPTGQVVIEDDDTYTTTPTVTLTLSFSDYTSGVLKLRFSNEAIGGDEPWEDPVETKEWELEPGTGVRTVYFQVMDIVGLVSEVYSDDIMLDTDLPTGTITVTGGTSRVNSTEVALDLTFEDATSPVDSIRFSNDGIWDVEEWQDATGSVTWTVPEGDGEKTVYYQVRDEAGQLSQTYTLTITLDTTAPYVESSDPADGDVNVLWSKNITIRFNEPMDTDSVEAAFTLFYRRHETMVIEVNGTFDWTPDGKVVTFNPEEQLGINIGYTVRIDTNASDLAGNHLDVDAETTFTSLNMPEQQDGDDDEGTGLWGLVIGLIVLVLVLVIVIALLMMRGKGGD